MNNLRGVYIIWYRDMLRFWHDRVRLIGAIALPLLFLFVFGSGLSSRMGILGPGVNFAQFIFSQRSFYKYLARKALGSPNPT